MLVLIAVFLFLLLSSVAAWVLIERALQSLLPERQRCEAFSARGSGVSPGEAFAIPGETPGPRFGNAGFFREKCLERASQGSWELLWAGFLAQGAVLLALSLLVPLQFFGIGFLLFLLGVTLCSERNRKRVWGILQSGASAVSWPGGAILIAGVALYCSQAPCNYDTLLYHHQATMWYSEFGSVRGLSLLHFRFGFISSAFALAAPFEFLMPHRTGTLVNGFALLLALMQFTEGAGRIITNRSTRRDWFAAFGLFGVLGLHLLFLEPASAAPDFLINVGTIAVASSLIGMGTIRSGKGACWATLIVAALLPTVKLSAAPVAIVVGLTILFSGRRGEFLARLKLLLLTSVFAAIPLVGTSWWQTGNLLFPLKETQTSASWGLESQSLEEVSDGIRDWARWSGERPEGVEESRWFEVWAKTSKGKLFLGAAAGNVLALLMLFCIRRKRKSQVWEIAIPCIGILGALYLLYAAPNPRFGFGMLVLGWCWLGQFFISKVFCRGLGVSPRVAKASPGETPGPRTYHRAGWVTAGRSLARTSLGVVSVVVLIGLAYRPKDEWRVALNTLQGAPFLGSDSGRINWLLPAKVPSVGFKRLPTGKIERAFEVEFGEDRIGEVVYYYPLNSDIAGAHELPVAFEKREGIQLYDPSKGIRGGFERSGGKRN